MRLKLTIHTLSRADRLVQTALEEAGYPTSRARLKTLFQEGQVLLEGRPLGPSKELPLGQTIEIEIADEMLETAVTGKSALPEPGGCKLRVLHEDDELLAFEKPSGMPSLPHSSHETGTVVNHAIAHAPALTDVFIDSLEPGLLHRLDTGTSGALLFAKTEAAFARWREAWKTPQVVKVYRALVHAAEIPPEHAADPTYVPPPEPTKWRLPLTIAHPIGHDAKSKKRMRVVDSDKEARRVRGTPQPALTRVTAVRALSDGRYDLTIEIETGVMHQIRAHLSYLGFPILGDTRYGREVSESRLWLHAWKCMTIESPLPPEWP